MTLQTCEMPWHAPTAASFCHRQVLEKLEPEPRIVHALFARQKAKLPKVRVFVDFLVQLFAPRARKRR